jgi:hypothetical protein
VNLGLREISNAVFDRLLYRRQFVLGPRSAPRGAGWSLYQVPGGLTLAAHPDLQVVQHHGAKLHLTLIGYMLDPRHPERFDREILALLAESAAVADLPFRTAPLGGRWALVAYDGSKGVIFTDACGMRQVHYTEPSHAEFWCGTQERGIAEPLGLDISASAHDFLESDYVKRVPEFWWPSGSSPYAGVRRLLPNHYLEWPSRAVRRFWPLEPVEPVSFEAAVSKCAETLRGLLDAGARRFPLALPLTAGYDSRLLLAAARELTSQLFCYTLRYPGYTRHHRDLRVARQVLESVGLQHHVLPCPSEVTGRFAEAYWRSVSPGPAEAAAIAQGLFTHYPAECACIVGHGGEIGRSYHYPRDQRPIEMTPETIARYFGMADNRLALQEFGLWLEDARHVEVDTGVRVLDLIPWEQRVGNWAAAGQAEWDIVLERLPPYSCRELLATMLGVDSVRHGWPAFELQVEVMRLLWPRVLSAPFNPPPRSSRDYLRSALERLGVADPIRALRDRVTKRK